MGSITPTTLEELSVLEQTAREAYTAAKYISAYCDLQGIKGPSLGASGDGAGCIRDAPHEVQVARQRLQSAALKLQHLAEDPTEYLAWHSVQYQVITAVGWLCHFEALSAIPLHSSISYDYLASICNVPRRQLQTMARMAMASNFLCEPEPGMVAHNAISRAFTASNSFAGWHKFMTGYYMPCAASSIAATEKWGETTHKQQTASNIAMNTPLSAFDFITSHKELGRLFSSYMKGVHSGIATNVNQVVQDFDWSSVGNGLVVHIDGSPGHVAIAVATAHPQIRFVVQDSAETLPNSRGLLRLQPVSVRNRIETKVHDHFDVQPTQNADIYMFRMALHNHSDEESVRIVKAVLPALKQNPAARLLIIDTVLSENPGVNGDARTEAMERYRDMVMLQVFASKERSLDEFKAILHAAGDGNGSLAILSVKKSPGATISTIEIGYNAAS